MPSEVSDLDTRSSTALNEDELAKSRSRVSRACTRCRTRKDKCDGARPRCSNCHSANQECNYEPATKKRGLPEGYVRGLEKLFALLSGKIDGFEDVTSRLLNNRRSELVKIWNHSVAGEELHTAWKDSKIIQGLENLLSSLDQSNAIAGQKRKRERDDEGSVLESEPDLTFHMKQEYHVVAGKDHPSSNMMPTANVDTTILTAPDAIVAAPTLPANALGLLDHYFAYTHCWFPVIQRPQLTRACYELSRGRIQAEKQNVAPLLWSIFAYTTSQLQQADSAMTPDQVQRSNSVIRELQAQSLALMPPSPQDFDEAHAQAFLILALCEIGDEKWQAAWIHIGQAVRIVLASLQSQKMVAPRAPGLLQGCVILDVVTASHLQCIPHLRRADIDLMPLMNEDSHEEWEPWNAPITTDGSHREPSFSISCFNRLTEICLVICDILCLPNQVGLYQTLHIQSLLAKLHQIQTKFPGRMPPDAQSPPHQIYLQLFHVSAQIHLVELPVDLSAGPNERAKLACNILSLLALCRNIKVIGLQFVPPFLSDGIEAALHLGQNFKICFGPMTGLPSFDDFHRTASDMIQEMSKTWPIYSGVLERYRSQLQTPSVSSVSHGISPSRHANLQAPDRSTSIVPLDSSPSHLRIGRPTTSHSQLGILARPQSNSLLNGFEVPFDNITFSPPARNAIDRTALIDFSPISNTPVRGFTANASMPDATFDFAMTGTEFPSHLNNEGQHDGLIMPETSPSFQGDEIDAIFHEMAHLDTNEWTDERALGLKEFGFNDDLTFQAFCNDPERLMVPPPLISGPGDGKTNTLSSESQTWMFAGAN